MDCTWFFTTLSGYIRIEFEFFRSQRAWDFVSVGEGNRTSEGLVTAMSGTELEVPKSIIVQRSIMWMRFQTTTSWNDDGFFAYVKTTEINGKQPENNNIRL